MSLPDGTPNTDVVALVLRDHAAVLRSFVMARVPADEVEDLLQRVALRAVERADTLEDADKALPWLYRLHRNAIVDANRKRASEQRFQERVAAEPELDPPVPLTADERCGCSVVLAGKMRPNHAEILTLVDIEGGTLREAAETLGITVNSATVRLHRARKALRERLRAHCGVTNVNECDDCRCIHDGCCAA